MTELRDTFLIWIRDAHAMEQQALTMMNGMLNRLDHYPALKERIARHVEETEQQANALQKLLDRDATGYSILKDILARVTAVGQAMSGVFVFDEVIKGLMASYIFEHMEIAAYRVLVKAAQQLGDTTGEHVFSRALRQEQEMAAFLADQLEPTTGIFMERMDASLTANAEPTARAAPSPRTSR